MAEAFFTIDGVSFPHVKVLGCTQTFEILDGENSTRTLSGEMIRDIIGTYFNYNLTLKPEKNADGIREFNKIWELCSQPKNSHSITVPNDRGSVTHTSRTFNAYITSGSRDMEKFNSKGVDYWGEAQFQFISMSPAITP